MEILGNHNDKFHGIKFLHSAIEEMNRKAEVTLTDYLALRLLFWLSEEKLRTTLMQWMKRMLICPMICGFTLSF